MNMFERDHQQPAHWMQGHLNLSMGRAESLLSQKFCISLRSWCQCKAYRWVIKAKSNFLNLQIQNLSGWVGHWYLISWVNFDMIWTLMWYELCYTDKKILSSFFKIYLWITDLFNSKVRGNDNNPWMSENYITSHQIIIFNRKTQQIYIVKFRNLVCRFYTFYLFSLVCVHFINLLAWSTSSWPSSSWYKVWNMLDH